ncbi:MAG: carbamoyltransferase HypF [Hyphomicrobiales bacterium]|nr:carbamoyltransferase HypF [Hyphomicrobiales bacterium]
MSCWRASRLKPDTALAERPLAGEIVSRVRERILVRGVVQGVGFRPFVYRQATKLDLSGWVINTAAGVTIEAEGSKQGVARLIEIIRAAPPASARVDEVETRPTGLRFHTSFVIRESEAAGPRTADIPVDLATCDDCLAELLDPANRRYRYPFVNCTQCGPRYSIITDMPYDRANTTMQAFAMCAVCRAEYDDPGSRRFHAEPNACPVCGPQMALRAGDGTPAESGDAALAAAVQAVRDGRIIAVKGIGGFHLICDAGNEAVVNELRARKQRESKPFAVMVPSLHDLAGCCRISPDEQMLLTGPERPIVLLRRHRDRLAPSVAPDNPRLGVMLPYTPLHHLLMRDLGFPVVATSGNIANAPIIIDEREALSRLGGVADFFLLHNRPIARPVDDSVARFVAGEPQILRCGRGYAPTRIPIPGVAPGIVGLGGHLKSAIAVSQADGVVLGSHIGDLESGASRRAYAQALTDITRLSDVTPRLMANDLHPDYATSGVSFSGGCPTASVQHHLAHVVACMAEQGVEPPVLGVSWDGSGFGPDETVWGGEFLLVDKAGWQRVGHLRPFRLPGGEKAVREPRRAALGLLFEIFGITGLAMSDLAPVAAFSAGERTVLAKMLEHGVNAPRTTSAGRLFDGIAALCGLCQINRYEGQAASTLEWSAGDGTSPHAYTFPVVSEKAGELTIDWGPALETAITDLRAGARSSAIAAAVHDGLVTAIANVATRVGVANVVLTGGCFQNARLTEGAADALRRNGSTPHWHQRIPPNDGGLALGQAVWVGWTADQGE